LIPIYEPLLSGNEKKYLNNCIDTNWISSQGSYILDFEQALAKYHNLNHAVVTSNCTAALHLSIKSLGIGPGDEVICPDLTFIAPANMIVLAGAKLVLVDIDPDTLTINPTLIEENISKRTKAIIVVHQFGHAAHMDEIVSIAKKHDLKIIEDNAESIGGKYKKQLLGTIGDVSTNSFFGNKIITTGEGGAVITNDDAVALKCRELRDHGMSYRKKYHHIDLGYNYRMTNLQAAIGLAQIEKLDEILLNRKKQMDSYYEMLTGVDGIILRKYQEWCDPVHWMMTITLDAQHNRDNFLKYMKMQGIDCRQMVNPVHHAQHFVESYDDGSFLNSISISKQSVHLPSSINLTNQQLEYICKCVKSFLILKIDAC
jgi:perosamine synthetase